MKGEITSVDLVNVYGYRCQKYGRELNLITEENYEEAMEIAKLRD